MQKIFLRKSLFLARSTSLSLETASFVIFLIIAYDISAYGLVHVFCIVHVLYYKNTLHAPLTIEHLASYL